MTAFYFVLGLSLGAFLGFLAAALCRMASDPICPVCCRKADEIDRMGMDPERPV